MSGEVNARDVNPEILFVPTLLMEMKAGRMRMPRFQRPFIWTPGQMLSLLNSIWNRYPVGGILLWDTDRPVANLDQIGPKSIPPKPAGTVSFVLDGQQRLSTLYGVLSLKEGEALDDWKWRVWFDLKEKEFSHVPKNQPAPWFFPLWCLVDSFAFLNACQTIKDSLPAESAQKYINIARELEDAFRTYKLPVTKIKNTSLTEAVRIFSLLNSSGVQISQDQMVSALTYREEVEGETSFDLSKEIDHLIAFLNESHFGNFKREIILRAILVELELDVYKANWDRILEEGKADFPGAVERCRNSLGAVIHFLAEEGISCGGLLPYSMQLVVLSAFFRKCKKPNAKQTTALKNWFWVSSYTAWFAGGNSTAIGLAIKDMAFLADGDRLGFASINLGEPATPFPTTFDFRSSRSRATLLFLLSLEPLDFEGGRIDARDMIAKRGYKALGYIFPSRPKNMSSELFRTPVNRILLNYGYRVDLKKRFLKWGTDKLPEELKTKILDSHGITPVAYQYLLRNQFAEFLKERLDNLREKELLFMKEKGVVLPIGKREVPTYPDIEGDENLQMELYWRQD